MKTARSILKNTLVSAGILLGMTLLCILLARIVDDNNPFASIAFTLAVALISRFTQGYVYGIVSALVGVMCVNFFFTYPFYRFNFTISGYPLTFIIMLAVSILISTLTTQIKNQEALRAEAEKHRLRADLLKSVSHDIRTPLASILGASSALANGQVVSEEARAELLAEIQSDAQWLIRMTENILSITRFNNAAAGISKVDEVAEEVLGSAVVKFKNLHPEIRVHIEPPEEILLVPTDATLLEQVFLNLFENSVRHGEHTKNIFVRYGAEGNQVVFHISDDGVGFPEGLLSDPFGAYDSHLRRPDQAGARNTGTGLTVCKAIVSTHGGYIKAYNLENSGAAVEFGLPLDMEQ